MDDAQKDAILQKLRSGAMASAVRVTLITRMVMDFKLPMDNLDDVNFIKETLRDYLKLDTENKVAYGVRESADRIATYLKVDINDVLITMGMVLKDKYGYTIDMNESVVRLKLKK